MTASNLKQLEDLARQRAAGELTEEQFLAAKQRLFHPDSLSDEDADAAASSIMLTLAGLALIIVGALMIRYNGWAIEHASGLAGFGTDAGFYIGTYGPAASFFIKAGSGWVGIARTNVDNLLFDAPFVNLCFLVIGGTLVLEGFKWIIFGKGKARNEQAEPN